MAGNGLQPTDLTVDWAREPLGVDEPAPRLGWVPRAAARGQGQSGSRVRVATSPRRLRQPDVWDSGEVASASPALRYAGPPLSSRTRYFWTTRLVDGDGVASAWSVPSWFETALLHTGDWTASWIGRRPGRARRPGPSPLLRRAFTIPGDVDSARLYATGLGYGEFFVNGVRVGEQVLDPPLTDYTRQILYRCFDVGELLRRGDNVLAAALGRGFYGLRTITVWGWHRAPWHGEPRMLCQLEVSLAGGGSLRMVSDGRWRTVPGPTLRDSVYAGERHDARREPLGWLAPGYDDTAWPAADLMDPPGGVLRAHQLPPIIVAASIASTASTPSGVYDFGSVLAGWARIEARGPRGANVRVRYGETLRAHGGVNNDNRHVHGETQTDSYILGGTGVETWEPRFSYKGFRYVEVTAPDHVTVGGVRARRVHTAVADTGDFSCSHELLGWLDAAAGHAILNNLHGLVTDTPTYEKNGWTADTHLIAETAIRHFDVHLLLRKWLRDVADAQRPDGGVPVIVPTPGWGTATDPCWSGAYPLVAWSLYQSYGDDDVLAEHYPRLAAFADHLHRACGEAGWLWPGRSYGDWLAPGHLLAPEGPQLAATAFVHLVAQRVSEIATILGRREHAERYRVVADHVAEAFQRAFFEPGTARYRTDADEEYRQTSTVLPLAFGLVPPHLAGEVADRLARDIVEDHDGHLNTGALGTKYLLPVLTSHGHADVAVTVATQTTPPGWGSWRETGTLHESWDVDARSHSHHFLGTASQWLREYVAGLRPTAPGWTRMAVEPIVDGRITAAGTSYRSVRGEARVAWRRTSGTFELDLTVPVGTLADVRIPATDRVRVTEGGAPFPALRGNGYATMTVPSGQYRFAAT